MPAVGLRLAAARGLGSAYWSSTTASQPHCARKECEQCSAIVSLDRIPTGSRRLARLAASQPWQQLPRSSQARAQAGHILGKEDSARISTDAGQVRAQGAADELGKSNSEGMLRSTDATSSTKGQEEYLCLLDGSSTNSRSTARSAQVSIAKNLRNSSFVFLGLALTRLGEVIPNVLRAGELPSWEDLIEGLSAADPLLVGVLAWTTRGAMLHSVKRQQEKEVDAEEMRAEAMDNFVDFIEKANAATGSVVIASLIKLTTDNYDLIADLPIKDTLGHYGQRALETFDFAKVLLEKLL
eukprot:SM000164S02247  [mRNA]  locus=s164:105724:106953:+ [translate_table: standard]